MKNIVLAKWRTEIVLFLRVAENEGNAMADDANRRDRPQGIGEFLYNEFRSAIQDIRQKLVEEGWFGRVVTPAPVIEVGKDDRDAQTSDRVSLDKLWSPRAPEHPREAPEPDLDHDR